MSTIKSSDEHLTLNADGSGNDIKFQSNGSEVASISDGGVVTATSFSGSGANLTGVGVAGISSSADATAMTIGSDERVAFKATTPKADLHLKVHNNGWTGSMLLEHNSGNKGWHIHPENNSENGLWFGYRADTTSAIGSESVTTHLQLTSDGRGKSQFTAKAWIIMNGTGSISIDDSHNVSSISDYGTGEYTINFSNNMATSTYPIFANGRENNKSVQPAHGSVSTSSFRVKSFDADTATIEDQNRIAALVFGD